MLEVSLFLSLVAIVVVPNFQLQTHVDPKLFFSEKRGILWEENNFLGFLCQWTIDMQIKQKRFVGK